MRFDRIETKLIALITIPLIALVAVSMFFVIYYVEGRMREDFQNKNNLELNNLAVIVAPFIYEYDFNAIKRELDVIMEDEDIYDVIVMDEAGTTIRSKGIVEPAAGENLVEKEIDIFHQDEIVGRLKMRFSLLRIDQEIQKLELITALLFITSFLVLVSLTYFFSRRLIIKPINELSDGVRHISQGDFDYRTSLKRRDELGELAASFNQMAKNLDKSHRALGESEERYALAQRTANIGSWDWNIRSGELHWSETIEPLFGFGRGEFGGTYEAFLACVHPEDRQYVIDSMNACLEEGKEYDIEHRIVWPDGTVRSVSEKGGVFRDENGKAIRMLGMVVDITQRKQAEAEIEGLTRDLEKRVEARTSELEAANIRLRELDRLKSMFIASMSHELRTPLNSIIGFTGIILQGMAGEVNEEQRRQLTRVKKSATHLLALIVDVIDVSKIEAGKVELLIEEFDLSALTREVENSFKVAVEEKSLKMSLEMPKRLSVKNDERRTKQVLVNLVGNAVKFTDRGKIEIEVREKDRRVQVSVRDTGIGIRKEDMGRLFKAFSQISNEDRPKQEGTGLGLYLSKKILDLLGGEIKAESEFGKGSVFTFTLPLKYEETKGGLTG